MDFMRAHKPAALAVLAALTSLSAVQAANISREYWNNVTGTTVASLTSNANYPNKPTGTTTLTLLEGPQNTGDNFGARVRGFVVAPATGNYVFWISSDDQSQLFLSTTEKSTDKVLIAQVTGYTSYRQWTKYTSQKSANIALTSGRKYYFEVLHKDGTGGDHFSVGWQLPSGTQERPIPNNRLQPFTTLAISATTASAAEGSAAKKAFTLTRGGDITKSFTLNLTPGGAAVMGPDYVLADLSPVTTTLKSVLFAGDADALTIANGQTSVAIPPVGSHYLEEYQAMDSWWRIKWKIARAYMLLGYGRHSFPFGKTIGSAEILDLDAKAYAIEKRLISQSAKFGNFRLNAGPDYWNNLSQDWVGGNLATIFELFNAGPTKYQALNNDCIIANYFPQMCGALANFGSVSGQYCRDVPDSDLLPAGQQKVQSPDLFGYEGRRDVVGANDLPSNVLSNPSYDWSTLVHEFAHDMDTQFGNDYGMHRVRDRKTYCSANLMNFQLAGSPFVYNGASGSQNPKDYVSGYAAGLTNQFQDYRSWEDAAETVTAYLLYPEYFRYHMAFSTVLKAKYDYLKNNLFGGKEFTNLHLLSRTTFPWFNQTTGDATVLSIPRVILDDILVKGSAARTFSVTFPANKSTVRVEFLSMDEKDVEPAEAATLNIPVSTGYQILGPASATITINNDD